LGRQRLPHTFFAHDTLTVARAVLGQRVVRLYQGERLSGRIVEVEAYLGEDDLACHARSGQTARNAAMFGPPGHAYVYLIYGMYHCLNLVTECAGTPAAILIRALEPEEGLATQQQLRQGRPLRDLTRGPGRLCQALAIDRTLNGHDLCAPDAALWLEAAPLPPDAIIAQSPRINVRGDERALTVPWRYYLQGNPWVSANRASSIQKTEETTQSKGG